MKQLLITLVLFSATLARAEVIETNRYRDILNYLTPDTLVVTDLDNTVIEPVQMLGSDQWGEAQGKILQAAGFDKAQATNLHVSLFSIIQHSTKVKTVESDTAQLIRELQKKNIPVMGLTARPVYIADRTEELLNSVNVNLTYLKEVKNIIDQDVRENKIVYKDGVIFVGGNNKGLVLKSVVDRFKTLKFKRILFIDDKPHHTTNVDNAFLNSGIEVKAFRYGAADEYVMAYDQSIADIQWSHFQKTGVILSDEQAKDRK